MPPRFTASVVLNVPGCWLKKASGTCVPSPNSLAGSEGCRAPTCSSRREPEAARIGYAEVVGPIGEFPVRRVAQPTLRCPPESERRRYFRQLPATKVVVRAEADTQPRPLSCHDACLVDRREETPAVSSAFGKPITSSGRFTPVALPEQPAMKASTRGGHGGGGGRRLAQSLTVTMWPGRSHMSGHSPGHPVTARSRRQVWNQVPVRVEPPVFAPVVHGGGLHCPRPVTPPPVRRPALHAGTG